MTKDQERKVAALAVGPVAAKKRKYSFFVYIGIFN